MATAMVSYAPKHIRTAWIVRRLGLTRLVTQRHRPLAEMTQHVIAVEARDAFKVTTANIGRATDELFAHIDTCSGCTQHAICDVARDFMDARAQLRGISAWT